MFLHFDYITSNAGCAGGIAAVSGVAVAANREAKGKNRKTSDMFESVSSSLSEVLFFLSERLMAAGDEDHVAMSSV